MRFLHSAHISEGFSIVGREDLQKSFNKLAKKERNRNKGYEMDKKWRMQLCVKNKNSKTFWGKKWNVAFNESNKRFIGSC